MATHSQGSQGKLIIEPSPSSESGGTYVFDSSSVRIEFLFENLALRRRIIGKGRGVRGTLSRASELGREGMRMVRGRITTYLTPNTVDLLADVVWGMTESPTGTFSLDEDLPYFAVMIDREAETFQYKDCKLDWLSINARVPSAGERGEPEFVILTMGIIGSTETLGETWPSPEPTFVPAAADAPYTIFDTDTAVSLFGENRPVEEFRLTWQNFLQPKAINCLDVHSIRSTDRLIRLYAKIPYNATTKDIHTTAVGGSSGSVTFTNGNMSTAFNFANLMQEIRSPTITGKNQIFYEVFANACSSGDIATATNRELQIVNDNTP